MIEERRQLAHADVAVLVDSGREHRATVLAEPVRIISASAKKGHPERGAADDHLLGEMRIVADRRRRQRRPDRISGTRGEVLPEKEAEIACYDLRRAGRFGSCFEP